MSVYFQQLNLKEKEERRQLKAKLRNRQVVARRHRRAARHAVKKRARACVKKLVKRRVHLSNIYLI